MKDYQLNHPDKNHEFAFSADHNSNIHISDAVYNGIHGYKCIGCKQLMQAVFPKKERHRRYFRHHSTDVKPADRCVFKDEEYRRELAVNILELKKVIHVPPLYKYPPKGVDGLAALIYPGMKVYAATVKKNRSYYEDLDGVARATRHFEADMGNLLFKADVVFYDEDDFPILFIQIIKRYGITPNDQAGLKRLGVNAIQITIPKDSPDAINRSLLNGERVKWIYNDDEQRTQYISLSSDDGQGVPTINADQGKLLSESFDCRKVQINNLIRAIDRCLASELYLRAEQGVREAVGVTRLEISRAEKRWIEFEEQYRAAAEVKYRDDLLSIDKRRAELAKRRTELTERYQRLVSRYQTKRSSLDQEAGLLELEIRNKEKALGGTGKTVEELLRGIELKHKQTMGRMELDFHRTIQSIESARERIKIGIRDERTTLSRFRQDLTAAPERNDLLKRSETDHFDRLEKFEEGEIARIQIEHNGLPERFEREGKSLIEGFECLRELADVTIKNRDASGESELSKRIRGLISAREYFPDISKAQSSFNRYRKAKEFLESPAFKEWVS